MNRDQILQTLKEAQDNNHSVIIETEPMYYHGFIKYFSNFHVTLHQEGHRFVIIDLDKISNVVCVEEM